MSNYLEKSRVYKGYHYSVLEPEMIQYLHNKTLEMMKIIIPIFEANNIRYMICGGTLLGAVTTGKFIPWDDDVDICVVEEDYEKMIKCLSENIPGWMIVQCDKSEMRYYHGWVKVRDKDSTVYPSEQKYQYNGVWIDLYKLKKIKRKDVNKVIVKEHIDYLKRRYTGRGDYSFVEMFKKISANNLILRLIKENAKSLFSTDEKEVFVIWSASKIVIDEDWCFPTREYEFEGMQLESFNCADEYLKRHYSTNYLELPPDEKRRVGINKIEFK